MQRIRCHYDFYSRLNQRIIDALIAALAFYLAYQIRFDGQVPPENEYQMWLFLGAIMLGQVLISLLLGTYQLVWRYIGLWDACVVGRSHAVFSAILFLIFLAAPDSWILLRIPRGIIVIQSLLSFTAAIGVRALRRILYEMLPARSRNGNRKRVVLIGAGSAGVMVSKEIASCADIKPVGFLDDDPKKIGAVINGLRVLGPLGSLPSVVGEHGVEEVLICLPKPPRATLRRLWALCQQLPVRMKIVPTLEEILQGKSNIAAFRDVDMNELLGRETVELSLSDSELAANYQGQRILITGAGGSIGSELACQLARLNPEELVLLDKDENGLNDVCVRLGADVREVAIRPVVADLRFSERLETVFSTFRPQIVFHAAAHKHVHLMEMNPCEAVLNNVVGTCNLVEYSAAFGAARFVLISTDKAVKPTSIMGATKRICEMIVQAQPHNGHSHFCCVRFGNVVGSRGSVVPIFQQQIARGGPVTLTHPDVERFLMTIPEAVSILIQAGTLASSGEIFVLEMGEPVRIQDMARDLIELSGLRPELDVPIEITQLRRGEKLRELLFDAAAERLLPTRHDKIKVIIGQPFEAGRFQELVAALEDAAHRGSSPDVHRTLRELNIGFQQEEVVGQDESEKELRAPASATALG